MRIENFISGTLKAVIATFTLLFPVFDIDAQEAESVQILFRQGSSVLDPNFANNSANLNKLQNIFRNNIVQTVQITAGASPEGSSNFNAALSEARADAVATWLRSNVRLGNAELSTTAVGVDWSGLLELVEQDSNMPFRDDVVNVILNTPERTIDRGVVRDTRKNALRSLRNGVPWQYMNEHFFPDLRGGVSRVTMQYIPITKAEEVPVPVVEEPVVIEEPDTATTIVVFREVVDTLDHPFYMSVRTNLLYDAFLTPSFGAEIYLGKGFSVAAEAWYTWLKSESRDRFWQTYGVDLSVRRYFGKAAQAKPLTGHHIGLYGQAVTYDFEFGGDGKMSNQDQWHFGGGVEYGYALPIGRRLNLDFTLGLGYLRGDYYEYEPMPGNGQYRWTATKQKSYFGPSKAEISLIWLIGKDNYNKSLRRGSNK